MKILTFPRFHITLIGMNDDGYRINGGIGFAIESPNIEIIIEPSNDIEVIDKRAFPLSPSGIHRLTSAIQNSVEKFNFQNKIKLLIKGEARSHFGFGTGTAIRLAALEGLFLVNEARYSSDKIIKLSGRGKTSGIGIHTYFSGGLIFDIGHKTKDFTLSPSNSRENRIEMPFVLKKIKMPEWKIGICVPNKIKPIDEDTESKFFNKTCPVKSVDVAETLYHVTYGLFPSIKENDFETFCKALRNIQNCFWKASERSIYGNQIFEIEKKLMKFGAKAVGLSSFGPSLFFFSKDIEYIKRKITKEVDCKIIMTRPINHGRIIQ